jgi:hypothetical protein
VSMNRYHPLLANELVFAERSEREEEVSAVSLPQPKLAPYPWRSLGGHLDYTDWPERERFAELDLAIEVRRDASPAESPVRFAPVMF